MNRILSLIVRHRFLGALFLSVLAGCQTTAPDPGVHPPSRTINPWQLTGKRPDRVLLVHIALPDNRRQSLMESWKDMGVSFPESAVGYLKPGTPFDLGAILTGSAPSESAAAVPSFEWAPYWSQALQRSPFTRHLCLAEETWGHAFAALNATDGKSIAFRGHGEAPLLALKQSLREDWPFIFFSFDARRVDNQPHWEQDLIATIAEAQQIRPLTVLVLTYPAITTPPPVKLRLAGIDGVKQVQRGILDIFFLKRSDLAQRARLASALKQSGKFEIVFSKQATGNRIHYIATYQKNAETFSPAVIEASLGSTGPDAVAVRSLTQLKNYTSLPLWLWSPHLKKNPVESAAHPTWLETPLFFANQFGTGNPVRDVFSTFLGSN